MTLLLLSPQSILSQDNAVPSATPSSASSTSALKEQFNTLAVRLAARLADTIARSKDHSVIVFDFVGPDRTLGALGAALADDLSTALAESPVKLRVKDHSDLNKLMEENGLESENIFDPGIAIWLAEDLDTQAFVLGKLERDAGSMKLSVMTYNVRDGRAIVGLSVAIPLTER